MGSKRDEHGRTPVRRQYLQHKKRYPGTILFFQLGDFYETFEEDARLVSQVCGITLTAREFGQGQRVPLAGVPVHAGEGYIAKLVRAGHKVAICQQLPPSGAPSPAPLWEPWIDHAASRGLVERQVVRVVTPGTVVEPSLLDERANNYLVALAADGPHAGLAYADVSTGEFCATQLSGPDWPRELSAELARLRPAECLVPDPAAGHGRRRPEDGALEEPLLSLLAGLSVTRCEPWRFEYDTAREKLQAHFGVATLDGFGLGPMPQAVRAAGALMQYLEETQQPSLGQLAELRTYTTSSFTMLDPATRRHLELTHSLRTGEVPGSLLWVLDQTATPMGGRLLRRWLTQPLLDIPLLEERQEAVATLVRQPAARAEAVGLWRKMGDLERLVNRAGQRVATPRDLAALRRALEVVPPLQKALSPAAEGPLGRLWEQLDPCQDLVDLLARALVPDPPATAAEGGLIAPGFSAELDQLKKDSAEARQWVAGLERAERERTGIKSLKVGYNKVFGYYIEVSNSNLKLVPPEYIRKQTLVGAERFITPELKEKEALILSAQEKMAELELHLFRQVCTQVAAARERVLGTAAAIAHLDVYAALAEVAVRHRYVRPKLTDGDEISIVAGRHPVVELTLSEQAFVPNDGYLSNKDAQLIVLTGPNMSGKSTYLRQVALIVLMAQIGSFVPAEAATIGVVDRIFTRIGAQDDIAYGQSTFMVEMAETANILLNSTPRSLVVLDEIGRGTSTYDGVAIAKAVVEYIHNHPRCGAKTLFATHYHELTEMEKFLPRVRNFRVDVLEEGDQVVFLHRVVPGGADKSYGIHVAKLAGVPKAVTRRAEEILKQLEESHRDRGVRPARRARADAGPVQLPLFAPPHPIIEGLKSLDLLSMTPLEALNKLYELQQRLTENGG